MISRYQKNAAIIFQYQIRFYSLIGSYIEEFLLIQNIILCQMKNPTSLLPLQVAGFKLRQVSWSDFPGPVDESMPWSAHIYWRIDYEIVDLKKKKIQLQLSISPRSWVRPEKKSDHLLNHEQGHYLIGGICALEILRRIENKKLLNQSNFQQMVIETIDRTIKDYVALEKSYDNQTDHRLNFKKQEEWDKFIYDRLLYYQQTYNSAKRKFVKIGDIPQKNKRLFPKIK